MDLKSALKSFKNKKVLVYGDVMLDRYLWGSCERISPEAPVPVVSVSGEETRLGGAGNVALNLKHLGGAPHLVSVSGNDKERTHLIDLLRNNHLDPKGIICDEKRKTSLKTRVLSKSQQMIRIDSEISDPISQNTLQKVLKEIREELSRADYKAIIIQDYDKGTITREIIESLTNYGFQAGIPVLADPKIRNFPHYKNLSVLKPNLDELKTGRGGNISSKIESLTPVCQALQKEQNIGKIFVTLSENGIYYYSANGSGILPTMVRKVSDVSGAGDTVLSILALAEITGLKEEDAALLSNMAAGIVCEDVGVVPVNLDRLEKKLDEFLKENG